ncbi:helix-turn-helix domain-containing protein [Yinghuangia sp. ASG 101]|uniref:helix-turn-helix domain-containing protein n=1 Tax=Yinghuangia sp. ASG 101 TaxID=2896848 RepID=UPI001E628944|nr:helix-turn-helix domain-containing protein [Yinghuangia sp. ASG 101]UGQ10969.1 helix-turn-helix domain-containing protein [Yinghuangia sp. ASG 101]
MIANRWMCDPRYSANARTLYAILVSYADTHCRDTGHGKPYRGELARQLGVSVSTLDRTLDEMEVAGLVTVEKRTAPGKAGLHDANLYHLHDSGVMWQDNGTWSDPLPSGVLAAEIAKSRTEERRRTKREAGVPRKGGVPKGVNTRARKAQNAAVSPAASATSAKDRLQPEGGGTGAATSRTVSEQGRVTEFEAGGGSASAATPGSTDAATVAAPVPPCLKNPHQNPSPEPEAPSARSAADARRAPHPGSALTETGGTAAADNSTREPQLTPDVAHVITALPDDLQALLTDITGSAAPLTLVRAIEHQFTERTPAELAARVQRRWYAHGYADKLAEGTLARPVGAAVAMVRAGTCGNARCEDGTDLDTRAACRACQERKADRRAVRRRAAPPAPRRQLPVSRTAADACPGCGFPETHGQPCEGCQARNGDVQHSAPEPAPAPSGRPQSAAAQANPNATTMTDDSAAHATPTRIPGTRRSLCFSCRTTPGRAAWAGLCGPCAAEALTPGLADTG